MSELLRIFVSATQDLETNRGIIGRTLAELPVQVGAEIRRYPPEGISYDTLFELMGNVDRVYFLMGGDITAPAGAEWDLAMRLQRSLMPLRAPTKPTPAAEQFLRNTVHQVTPNEWRSFESDADLARIVGLDLINMLLHPTNRYGVSVVEIQRLQNHRQTLENVSVDTNTDPGGTEGGGVILGRQNI